MTLSALSFNHAKWLMLSSKAVKEDDVEEATFAAENKSADSMEEIVEEVEGNTTNMTLNSRFKCCLEVSQILPDLWDSFLNQSYLINCRSTNYG